MQSYRNKVVHRFSNKIYSNENLIARLDFRLAYNHIAVQCVTHYHLGNTPLKMSVLLKSFK